MRFPRFVLAELNTHRMIAKSSQSSRAIPVEKRIQEVVDDPFIPRAFGKNKPGMQAAENLDDATTQVALEQWMLARDCAVTQARRLTQLGVHKQLANRILEPFAHVTTVLTATEWDNFFTLRTHKDAQPEFQELALLMLGQYHASKPRRIHEGQWHLPYITNEDRDTLTEEQLRLVSVARCARVSYTPHDGCADDYGKDIVLAHKLIDAKHMSPFDHQGRPFYAYLDNPNDQRHFVGFVPYRVEVERAVSMNCRNFFNI